MAFFDERFNTADFFYGKEPNDFLFEKSLALYANSNILSIGEGEGRNAIFLAKKGHQVLALDESIVGLEKALVFAKENKVSIEILKADLNDYVFGENKYDAIISIWCHLPSALRKKVHQDCVKALKPGGFFILEAYTPKQLENNSGGPKNIDMLMTLTALEDELNGMRIINGEELDRMVSEGTGHVGMSAVVQILAQKL